MRDFLRDRFSTALVLVTVAATSLTGAVGSAAAEPTPGADVGGSVTTGPLTSPTSPDLGVAPREVGFRDDTLSAAPTIPVVGTFMTVAGEDGSPDSYSVTTRSGRVIPVAAEFEQRPASGGRFEGDLAVPLELAKQLSLDPGVEVGGAVRRQVLAQATAGSPLPISEAVLTAAAATTAHRWLIAIPTNWGNGVNNSMGMTDADLLAKVNAVRDYWLDESDGVLSIEIVPTFFRYATAYPNIADCGLSADGADFAPITNEAAVKTGARDGVADHVLVLVPPSCAVNKILGLGSVGDSFDQSHGRLIAAVTAPFVMTLAHELGHNYGLGHSGLSTCASGFCPASGTASEYGGYYEPMAGAFAGDGPPALGTPHRYFEGLTADAELLSADPTQRDASFTTTSTIYPRVAESQQRSVHFVDPDTGFDVFVDYRDGLDRDVGSTYALGRSTSGATYRPGVVVEALYGNAVWVGGAPTQTSMNASGQRWTNSSGNYVVTLSSIGAGRAVVSTSYTMASRFSSGSLSLSPGVRAREWVDSTTVGLSPTPTRVNYQWYVDGSPLVGATSSDLFVPIDLVGKTLTLEAMAYARGRHPLRMSASTVVAPARLMRYGSALTVFGSARVGQPLTVYGTGASTYDARGYSVPNTSTVRWLRSGVPIPGATGSTYLLTSADLGAVISVTETLSASGYESLVLTSGSTATIAAEPVVATPSSTTVSRPTLTPTSSPTAAATKSISASPTVGTGTAAATGTMTRVSAWLGGSPKVLGKARRGRTVRAYVGTWQPGTQFTYQWYVNGRARSALNRSSLVINRRWRGKTISVRVTGTLSGYLTAAPQSAPIRVR